jgi:hypothetical protein
MGTNMTNPKENLTHQDLAQAIENLAIMVAEGFAEMATKSDIARLEGRIDCLEGNQHETNRRLVTVEEKMDRALYREIPRHENLIHQLADKTHVKLEY